MTSDNNFTAGTGNVFADLGFDQPEEMRAKAQIAYEITRIITHRHLTQSDAAAELGLTQPKVSQIMAGRLDGFSLGKLIAIMVRLNRDVEIIIKKKPRTRNQAHLRVVCA